MQPDNKIELRHIESELRHQDPLGTIERGIGSEQTAAVWEDIRRVDTILDSDQTLSFKEKQELYDMGINLRLDWMYSKYGGKQLDFPQFEAQAKAATEFFDKAMEHAHERQSHDPTIAWNVQTIWNRIAPTDTCGSQKQLIRAYRRQRKPARQET
jgi:hypothetical protein